MKRIILSLACTMASATGLAQQALDWNKAPLASPVVNADKSVTFNINAPEAQKVEIVGDFLPIEKVKTPRGEYDRQGPQLLKKNEKGVWSFTSTPLQPELYTYNILIDGVKVTDPLNVYAVRDIASTFSIFMIDGGVNGLYQVKDVPHGTVSKTWYKSPKANMTRRLTIYTPAGYEQRRIKRIEPSLVYQWVGSIHCTSLSITLTLSITSDCFLQLLNPIRRRLLHRYTRIQKTRLTISSKALLHSFG